MSRITVGVFGASGYMGGEALRVLIEHPEVDVCWATSRNPGPIETFHPNLLGTGIETVAPDSVEACDAVFLAIPTEATIPVADRFLGQGSRVIDLGSAFRLKDRTTWENVYGIPHTKWPLAEEAVYGISELRETEIARARLIANPGCFSSAAILGLAPLLAARWIDPQAIVVDGLSGTAGAGAEASRAAHHPEISGNLVPYNVVGHRHTFEMEEQLSDVAGSPVRVHFTPIYVPIVRGILAVCHAFPTEHFDRGEALDAFRVFYRDSPFVSVYDLPEETGASWQYRPYPWVSAVAGTNRCHIGLDVDPERGRVVIFAALDSIGKGGAHAGVENLNLMFGQPRTAGLERLGRHP